MGKPTIRFEGYTDDWEQRKVSEIAIEKLSNGIMNNQSDDETGVKHINVINMYDTDKIHPEKLTFSNYDEEAVKKCNVEFGDIFLTRSSLKPEGIAEANVLLDSGRFVYDDHLIRLKVNKEKYDPFFVKLNLSGNAFKRQFIVRAKTTAFTTIGQEDISECLGFFPKKEEQQQIGEYFMTLDHLITLHHRKCEETKKLKKFMLQKMFPKKGEKVPDIRFDGFTDDWEQRKLSEISDVRDGTHDSPSYLSDGHPFVTSKNVKDGYINYDDVQYISDEDFEAINKRSKVDMNDILMGMIGTIGNLALIRTEPDFAIKNVALIKDTKQVSYMYLYHYLQSSSAERQLLSGLDGGTQKFVSLKNIRELNIMVPSEAEQLKVGNFIESLDHLITLHQHKCEELQNIKKFMLQNMFT